MATFYGVNKTLNRAAIPSLAGQGEQGGNVKCIYDEYAPATVVAISSVIQFGGLLPAGARVVDVAIAFPDQGTTGTAILGWEASADGVEVADDNGFMAAISLKAAADCFTMLATDANVPGTGKKFASPVQVSLTLSEAIDAGTGLIKVWVYYIID